MKKVVRNLTIVLLFLIFTLIIEAQPAQQGVSLVLGDSDGDGYEDIVIENRFIRFSIQPHMGGKCTNLTCKKTGATFGNRETASRFRGFFKEFTSKQNPREGFHTQNYLFEILERGPKRASVRLRSRGEGNALWFVIEKTISVEKDSSQIIVEYKIKNRIESQTTLPFSMRLHNLMGYPEKNVSFYFPLESGVRRVDRSVSFQEFFRNPARGWIGGITQGGTGIVYTMEYPLTEWFLTCISGNYFTLEWNTVPRKIDAGRSISIRCALHVFSGLPKISDANPDWVASFDRRDKEGILSLIPARPMDALYTLTLRKLSNGMEKTLKSGRITVDSNVMETIYFPLPAPMKGTYEVALNLDYGTKTAAFVAPLIMGKEDVKYVLVPKEKRLKPEKAKKVYFRPSPEVITPHVIWAKPYVEGKSRVLFLVDIHRQREIIELSQRFDISYLAANISVRKGFSLKHWNTWVKPGEEYPDEKDGVRHAEKLVNESNYDCLVIGDAQHKHYRKSLFFWKELTKDARDTILRKVEEEGKGLVYVHPTGLDKEAERALMEGLREVGPEHYIVSGIPFDCLDKLKRSMIKVKEYGQGRIVILGYPAMALTPYYHLLEENKYIDGGFHYWEYHLAALGRAILWASKRESKTDFDVVLDEKEGAGKQLLIKCSQIAGAEVRIVHRNRFYEEILTKTLPLNTSISVDITSPENGLNVIDTWLMKDSKIVDWRTITFQIKRESGFEVSPRSIVSEINQPIILKVNCHNTGNGQSLMVEVRDTFGRVEFKKTFPAKPGRQEISVSIPNPYRVYHKCFLRLQDGNQNIQSEKINIYIPSVDRKLIDRFFFVLLGGMHNTTPDYLIPHVYKRIYEMGFDGLCLGRAKRKPVIPRVELCVQSPLSFECWNVLGRHRFYKYDFHKRAAAYASTHDKKYLIDEPSPLAPDFHKKISDMVKNTAEFSKPYGLYFFVLDDETKYQAENPDRIVDTSMDDTTLKHFRRWLKSEYGSMSRLNLEWETEYKSFDNVMPLTYYELKNRHNFAPWSDFKTFMDNVFISQTKVAVDAIKSVNPQAIVTESGIVLKPAVYNRYDWYKNMQVLDGIQYYGNNRFVSSMFPQKHFSKWLGYAWPELAYCEVMWRSLFHGDKCQTYYYGGTYVLPDFRPSVNAEREIPYIREIGRGLGDYISRSQRARSLIAIRHDQRSLQAALVLKDRSRVNTYDLYRDISDRYALTCERTAIPYEYMDSNQITQGELEHKKIPILIIPTGYSISKEEATEIKRFARGGGIVIADVNCGLFDEHLKLYEKPILDSFFGIERTGRSNIKRCPKTFIKLAPKSPFKTSGKTLGVEIVETDVDGMKDSRSLGTFQSNTDIENGFHFFKMGRSSRGDALFYKKHAKGASLYLSCIPGNFTYDNGESFLVDILESAGEKRMFRLEKKDGTPYSSSEWMQFRRGAAVILTGLPLLKGPVDFDTSTASVKSLEQKGESVRLLCTEKNHLYEMRTGKYYGYGNVFEEYLAPLNPRVFVALPYKITRIKAERIARAVKPGSCVTISGRVLTGKRNHPIPFEHLIRAEVFNPRGRYVREYSGLAKDQGAGFKFLIQFAHNDPVGNWRIELREIISSIKTYVEVRLKE